MAQRSFLVSLRTAFSDSAIGLPIWMFFTPAEAFPSMLTSEFALRELLSMNWTICTLHPPTPYLLTSDRPIIMTNGLMHDQGHIALPISPRSFFLAYRSEDFYRAVSARSEQELAETVNNHVAKQAINFVYTFDESQSYRIATGRGNARRLSISRCSRPSVSHPQLREILGSKQGLSSRAFPPRLSHIPHSGMRC
jgi:hypothetical protein